MNETATTIDRSDQGILSFEVSDAALEAAASPINPGAAFSFPNAPTVSVIVLCCGNDEAS